MPTKVSLRSFLISLKKVYKRVLLYLKKTPKAGAPEWLDVGISKDGKKRVYYFRLRFPRPLLLLYLRWRKFSIRHRLWSRLIAIGVVVVLLGSIFYQLYEVKTVDDKYKIERAQFLLPTTRQQYAEKLVQNGDGSYSYNKGYKAPNEVGGLVSGPKFGAEISADNKLTVNDPNESTSFSFTPKFDLEAPQQSENRLVFPITSKMGSLVYTFQSASIKEDIVLFEKGADSMQFSYELKLASELEARLEKDGSVGIYGPDSALLGNVSTASEKDAELLQKARTRAKKDKIIFTIPPPVIMEEAKKISNFAKATYTLKNNILTVHATNLRSATYPLSIDPSVYIETAAKLMRGNNEGNVDFDVSNELIQKSQTTGARIDNWSDTTNLPYNIWNNAVTAAGGYIYSVGGVRDTLTTTTYTSTGAGTFPVPVGVTNITVKLWGAGGGGGGGGSNSIGGAGGGGGFTTSTLTVTPGESLSVYVGSAGTAGTGRSDSGDGGGGGGHSEIHRAGTRLVIAPGGGGGGGGDNDTDAAAGGEGAPGGNTLGIAGSDSDSASGGAGGTQAAGGAAGTGGRNTGTAGGLETAGDGADGRSSAGSDGGANNGGQADDGDGGTGSVSNNYAGGGGGGGGYYGGGGGSGSVNADAGGGGGGSGSCYTSGSGAWCVAGSAKTPGNSTDSDIGSAATGGNAGALTSNGTAGGAGKVVISYVSATTNTANVYWAQIDSSNSSIKTNTNPGNGSCAGWCTDSAYSLPANRVGMSLVAYNGFLYALGGSSDLTAANGSSTVYIAKIGANGEPQLWHPTDTNKSNWTYWYTTTNTLPAAVSYSAITVYNNRLYLVGGRNTSGNSVSTVHSATINPNGDISSWSTTGMQDLTTPSARFGHSVHVYNGIMYLIGGNNNGTILNTVYYSKLTSTGAMNTWVSTSNFTTARASYGGSFTTVWGGYIYIGGGCTALTSGNCSTVATDNQIASINADGSLSEWNTILNLETKRIGYTIIGWQGGLYRIGGCQNIDTSTGACYYAHIDNEYGVINVDGEASTVATSAASGTSPCSGAAPYNCNLPGSVGNMLNASIISNGYLYIMGGCTNNACTTYSTGVTYQAIGSDGALQRPAACNGSYTDSYCVNTTSLPTALGGSATAAYNGYIYIIGGFPSITSIYRALPAADGGISAFNATTYASISATDMSYSTAYIRANPSSASSSPANLFLFGGCTGNTGIGCSGESDLVYKCNVDSSGVPSACSTSGQAQIGTPTGDSAPGLGAHAMAVYANYIYLMGGLGQNVTDLKEVQYAKFDDSNNVVNVATGSGAAGQTFTKLSLQMQLGRRRGSGFGYNGYLYIVGGYDGTTGGGVLADIEFAKINVSDGTISSPTGSGNVFKVSSVYINQRWGLTVPVSNSYAYVIGGCIKGQSPSNCNTRTSTIQTFQIYNNDSGMVKSYSTMTDDTFSTVTDRWGVSSVVLNGYIYVAGGCKVTTDCSGGGAGDNVTNDVQYAAISAVDGSVGNWASTTNVLPTDRAWGKLVTAGGYLYYIGGQDDTATNEQSTVYYVGTFSSGDITASWSTASGALGDVSTVGVQTAPRTKFGVAVWDNRIYVIGGLDGSAADTSTVYYSPKLTNGGDIAADSWTLGANSPDVARFGGALTAYANNLYYFGGNDGTNYLADGQIASLGYKTGTISQSGATVTGSGTTFTSAMQGSTIQYSDGSTATINTYNSATSLTVSVSKTVDASSSYVILDGSVGSWTFTTSLSSNISQAELVAANGYMYIIGGRSATSTCSPSTLAAPISANTTIAAGNNPTGVGEWSETNVRYAGGRYGAAVSYYQGKVYIMGGGCTAPQNGGYSTGTVGQATTTVTGVGTTWTDDLIGGTITISGGSAETIVKVTDATHLTVNTSQTLSAGRAYTITVPRHQYGVLKSQPQFASYSRMIDTDSNVFPNSWLVNGIDNSVGARWQTQYKSAYDASNVVFHSSFEEGTNGGTLPASGSGLNAYDTCTTNGSATRLYDNAWYQSRGLSGKFTTPGGLTHSAYCADTYTDTTVRYERFYMRLSSGSFPSTTTTVYSLDDATSGGNQVMDMRITNTGGLQIRNNTTTAATPTIDTNGMANRVEVGLSAGTVTVRVFRESTGNLNGQVPDSVTTFTASGESQTDTSTLGIASATSTTAWSVWFDDHKSSQSNWVGPAYAAWGENKNYGDVFMGDVAAYYPLASTYSTGTITQSSSTVTAGGGAVFIDEMIGGRITYLDGTTDTITAVASGGASLTVAGSKTIGSAQTYTISNINTNFARWYFFFVSIDASQTFGYPEDVSRGPTIWDLSLFFTADPSKRLRHGKTFTGGELQPLDTPCRTSVDAQCPLP